MPIVRTMQANWGETVEIQWRTADGQMYFERRTMPPAAVVGARIENPHGEHLAPNGKPIDGYPLQQA